MTRQRRECRHPFFDQLIEGCDVDTVDGLKRMICEYCGVCGAWMSLGPANDDDPRVAVEVRAAEIAILSVERRASAPIEWCSIQEWFGLDAADDIGEGYLAGHLARTIAAHDEKGEG